MLRKVTDFRLLFFFSDSICQGKSRIDPAAKKFSVGFCTSFSRMKTGFGWCFLLNHCHLAEHSVVLCNFCLSVDFWQVTLWKTQVLTYTCFLVCCLVLLYFIWGVPNLNCMCFVFQESVLNFRLDPLGIVEGFTAEVGASGVFCPTHMTLPVEVSFYSVSDDNAPSPYMVSVWLDLFEINSDRWRWRTKGWWAEGSGNGDLQGPGLFSTAYDGVLLSLLPFPN